MSKRASKPTALKVIEGNRGKRPLPENEPKPRPKAPACPSFLDAEGKRLWKKLAPKLERMGLLTEVDGEVFTTLCTAWSQFVACGKFIKEENQSLMQKVDRPDPDGGTHEEIKVSPYVTLQKQLSEVIRKLASEFGLSPRGRTGLSVGTEKNDDGADLLSQ